MSLTQLLVGSSWVRFQRVKARITCGFSKFLGWQGALAVHPGPGQRSTGVVGVFSIRETGELPAKASSCLTVAARYKPSSCQFPLPRGSEPQKRKPRASREALGARDVACARCIDHSARQINASKHARHTARPHGHFFAVLSPAGPDDSLHRAATVRQLHGARAQQIANSREVANNNIPPVPAPVPVPVPLPPVPIVNEGKAVNGDDAAVDQVVPVADDVF